MNVAIIGPERAKFTRETYGQACRIIKHLLDRPDVTLVSGRCPLGGVDVWAERYADAKGIPKRIFPPAVENWSQGYKPRNIRIAETADVVHVLALKEYPESYEYERFQLCYHCARTRNKGLDHVKGGACWTAHYAIKLGKQAIWHIIPPVGRGQS